MATLERRRSFRRIIEFPIRRRSLTRGEGGLSRPGRAPWHDRGYKRLFSHPAAVEELPRGFLQEDWTARLDFRTLEMVGNSFVTADLRERHSDLVWRLRFRGEGEGWFYLYLLLELQSTSDPFMA